MDRKLDVPNLVSRAKAGTITDRELSTVADRLADNPESDVYELLYVLTRSGVRSYEGIVARFLDYRSDPMVARLALQSLCTFWGLTERYIDTVREFLRGVDWDVFGEVRQVAITAAGEFLSEHRRDDLLRELLRLSGVENSDTIERRIAVEALARSLGEPLAETINADKGSIDWDTWAQAIRERGYRRAVSDDR